MSDGASIWLAVTGPGPVARSVMRLGPSACMRSASCLMLRTMSTTSSRTPSHRGELVHDAVDLDGGDRRALQATTAARGAGELPSVTPKPRSSGSATMRALRAASAPVSISGFSGRISSFQFRSITGGSSLSDAVSPAAADRASEGEGRWIGTLDAPALGRPAAVVRNGRYVADGGDGHAGRLQRAQRRLAARAGAGDVDLQGLHAVLGRLSCRRPRPPSGRRRASTCASP